MHRIHRYRPARFLMPLLISFCQMVSPVRAEEPVAGSGPDLFVGAEYFVWEEFDDVDRSLLQETGVRITLGAAKSNLNRRSAGPVYEVRLRSYFGDLLYDGQIQNGDPLETDVAYRGNQLKASLGGRIDAGGWLFVDLIDVMGGLGIEYWTRDIDDGITRTGIKAKGVKEDYHVRFHEFSIGLVDLYGEGMSYLQVGARKPMETREGVSILDNPGRLSPGREWSMFARYTISPVARFSRYEHSATLYFESYRFSKSPAISNSIGGDPVLVLQPKSSLDIFGIQFESRF